MSVSWTICRGCMKKDPQRRVDYDQVAPVYDMRFAYYAGTQKGIGAALVDLVGQVHAHHVLEVGCGTGHWLRLLALLGCKLHGLDLSLGMLCRARIAGAANLVQGGAEALPFPAAMFDLVFCVSALHHFADAGAFIRAARLLLRPGGALAIIGLNPHSGRDHWYLYDCFPGTLQADLGRYPSPGAIVDWMIAAGFDVVRWQEVERLRDSRAGRDILAEPMLHKNSTSQLTLLTDEEYSLGIARIRAAIANTEAIGEEPVFSVDVSLQMVAGLLEK